jgi:hypothetical protein
LTIKITSAVTPLAAMMTAVNEDDDPVELLIVDPHAFDSQIGKVVPVMVNGQVVGRARLSSVTYTEEDGWHYELTTVTEDPRE